MYNKAVHKHTLTFAAIGAVMLLATTVISIVMTENAFAYDKNQAKSDINECGNGFVPVNVGCQNIDSQIQGDRNTVAMAGEQRFEDGNGPPPPPGACQECFDPLTDTEVQQLAVVLSDRFGLEFPDNPTRTEILNIICEALEQGPPPPGLVPGQINGALNQIDTVTNAVRQAIHACLNALF
jgi:hypothetical protein